MEEERQRKIAAKKEKRKRRDSESVITIGERRVFSVNTKEWTHVIQIVVRQINRCFSLQIKTDILMLNAV